MLSRLCPTVLTRSVTDDPAEVVDVNEVSVTPMFRRAEVHETFAELNRELEESRTEIIVRAEERQEWRTERNLLRKSVRTSTD